MLVRRRPIASFLPFLLCSFPSIELGQDSGVQKNGNWNDSFFSLTAACDFWYTFSRNKQKCNVYGAVYLKKITYGNFYKSICEAVLCVLLYNMKSRKCVKYQDQLRKNEKIFMGQNKVFQSFNNVTSLLLQQTYNYNPNLAAFFSKLLYIHFSPTTHKPGIQKIQMK